MPALPTGTVTFLFTDIEGSTQLLQQTLRGAIGWSHDLMDPEEQVPFLRLDVFVGGRTLEAAAETPLPRRHTLGQAVGYFKYQSTKRINEIRGTPGAMVWQRGF